MSNDPTDVQDALRGASDGLLVAIREVDARERLKRAVRPNDPSFSPLAREVRIAAETVLSLAREEEKRAAQAAAGEATGLPTINDTRPPADLAGILAEWRAVERELELAQPTSPEAGLLMEQFERLRDAYASALKGYRPD